MTTESDAVERASRCGLEPLWAELWRRFGASDRPVRSVRLRGLTQEHRVALADLLGLSRVPAADVTVQVARVAAGLRVEEPDLRPIVARLHGPIVNRAATAARERQDRDGLWAEVAAAVEGRGLAAWVMRLRAAGIPDGDVDAHRVRLDAVLAVLAALPSAEDVPLPVLAARLLRDPHALDAGWVATVVLDALATLQGRATPTSAEQARDVWAAAGVVRDRLSSPVLTLGLTCGSSSPLAKHLDAMRAAGEPVALTASQVRRWPVVPPNGAVGLQRAVVVIENPSVLEAARGASVMTPLICTASWPTEAAVLLLDQLRAGGVELRYHSDFDATGLALTGHMARRFDARPWRMGAYDYAAAAEHATFPLADADRLPPTPWDADLRELMRSRGVVVFEEDVVGTLLHELGG